MFPTARGALVSPTSVASRDTTHKCPRCRKEFLSTINQRRCLAVHLGARAGGPGGKAGGSGAKPATMPGAAPRRGHLGIWRRAAPAVPR